MRWALIAIACFACSQKKSEPKAEADLPVRTEPGKPIPKIACETAIPKAVLDAHFAGWKPEFSKTVEGPGVNITTCRLVGRDKQTTIDYRCGPNFEDFDKYFALIAKVDDSVKRVEGIGRAGFRSKYEVGAYHRTHACVIAVARSPLDDDDVDFVPIVKALEAALPD
jgi:hypothetical protein